MTISGPFNSYIPPTVTTETTVSDDTSGIPSGIQVPIFVGTGRETLNRENVELVRGSSSVVDQLSNEEFVSDRFIVGEDNGSFVLGDTDGLANRFKVIHAPIVRGDGQGRTTFRPQDVQVTVDGIQQVVAAVDGERGIITLQVPPPGGSTVRATYSYNRTDTSETDDVSEQVSDSLATLLSGNAGPFEIEEGETDTFILHVNGERHEIVLDAGAAESAATVADQLDVIAELSVTVELDAQGNDRLRLSSNASLQIANGSANDVLGFSSGQRTDRNREFFVYNGPLVTGDNSGTTTTSLGDVTVRVNGQTVQPEAVDGSNRMIRLRMAPPIGATVEIDYFWNTFQNTYDPLPNRDIRDIDLVGDSPGRGDYVESLDFILDNDTILWGSAVTVEADRFTSAGTNEPFEDQIFAQLEDNKIFLEEVERKLDRSFAPPRPSRRTFILGQTPTDGTGKGNATTDPQKIEIYHGPNLVSALLADRSEVVRVDPETREVTVKEPIPPSNIVFATYYYNRLRNDQYTLTRTSGGRVSIRSESRDQELFNVEADDSGVTAGVNWPGTVTDALISGRNGLRETVEVLFKEDVGATQAIFTNEDSDLYDTTSGTSDTLIMGLVDNWVTATTATVDLTSAAPAILVSDKLEAGITFDIDALGTDADFDISVDGSTESVDLSNGTYLDNTAATLAEVASAINTIVGTDIAYALSHTDGEYLILRSPTTPTSPDDLSRVRILSGDVHGMLGFEAMQMANGAESAVIKPATLLTDEITPADIADLATGNFDLELSVNGDDYLVEGADLAGVTSVTDIQTAIGDVIDVAGANVAAVDVVDTDFIRITTNMDFGSSIEIINDATGRLSFESNFAEFREVSAAEVVAVINDAIVGDWTAVTGSDIDPADDAELNFHTKVVTEADQNFVRFKSFGTGTNTSFTFTGGSALLPLGIDAGTSATGEDGVDGFDVQSDKSNGSQGEGIVGQTYTDEQTGLRFTVKPGDYVAGDELVLRVRSQMAVGTTRVNRAMAGLVTYISSLTNVAQNDTALVTTYTGDGSEPSVGDFYYISYTYQKRDFNPNLFTQFRSVEENFGRLSPENTLSLACYLALLNGASIVGAKQVLKDDNSNQASSSKFIEALDEITEELRPGIRGDILVPLSSDLGVMQSYTKHCEVQASPRNQNERRAFFGVASGSDTEGAIQIARTLESERALLVYPDSAVLSLTNQLGNTSSFLVDSTFIAAALAGATASPALDVATPMTRNRIVGFDRLNRSLDSTQKNRLAVNGVTVVVERPGFLQVRQGLTTDVTNRFTATPSIIAIKDFVQQQTRAALDRFIGLKFLTQRSQDVELAVNGLLGSLVEADIITAFTGVSAEPDPNDPSVLRVEAFYAPVFPLLYIPVRYTISSEV